MKLFEIEKDGDYPGEIALKVLGLPVVTFTTIPGYIREVEIGLGVVNIELGVYSLLGDRCGSTLVDVAPSFGVRMRGPERFKVFPIPYARVRLDTFVGCIGVDVL